MVWRKSILPNSKAMLLGGIALVLFEQVLGILLVQLAHQAVTRHLRQDGRRRNRVAQRIAMDDAAHLAGYVQLIDGVHEEQIARRILRGERHGVLRRIENVHAVDLLRRGQNDPGINSRFQNLIIERFAALFAQLLAQLFLLRKLVQHMHQFQL